MTYIAHEANIRSDQEIFLWKNHRGNAQMRLRAYFVFKSGTSKALGVKAFLYKW